MRKVIEEYDRATILQRSHTVGSYEYVVKRDAQLTLVLVIEQRTRKELHTTVRLTEPGASVQIIGIVIGTDNHSLSLHTLQHHQAPETTSDLLVKSVLTDDAKLLYDGAIRVDPAAQKTDAYQRNENLLLSGAASAESKPSLEILADDVRCTHGATVGRIGDDELWYLATRGIGTEMGTRLIIEGFLESAISRIRDTIRKREVRRYVWQILYR